MTDGGRRPAYGIDAPTVVRNVAIASIGLFTTGSAWRYVIGEHGDGPMVLLSTAACLASVCAVMYWSSRIGKLGVRDRLFDSLVWRGDEQVLDVGCGRGLAAIGAARRLTSGRVIGIDIWSQDDLSNNGPEAAYANADIEGVRERVAFQTADARQLPFDDASFDVVVSMTALHNIPRSDDRAVALAEIRRVLRPGGRLALFDLFKTGEYREWLAGAGFTAITVSGPTFLWLMPGRRITAVAPLG